MRVTIRAPGAIVAAVLLLAGCAPGGGRGAAPQVAAPSGGSALTPALSQGEMGQPGAVPAVAGEAAGTGGAPGSAGVVGAGAAGTGGAAPPLATVHVGIVGATTEVGQ